MSITAESVRELREKTGVGMMDCKKALEHAQGNFEEAVKYLREKGLAAATKKSDRTAKEGQVFVAVNAAQTAGVILELNCETDFVANNDSFKQIGSALAQHILDHQVASLESLQATSIQGHLFPEFIAEAILKLGENISVKQFTLIQGAVAFGSYIHMNGKIGVLVQFDAAIDAEMGRDVAMHVAASAPLYTNPQDVPAEEVKKEEEIIKAQALNEGKPAAILDKVVAGKINKFYKDICLNQQAFVKDQDRTVEQVLSGKANVVRFVRYSLS